MSGKPGKPEKPEKNREDRKKDIHITGTPVSEIQHNTLPGLQCQIVPGPVHKDIDPLRCR